MGNYVAVRLLFEGDTCDVEELFEGEPWRSRIQQRQNTQVQQKKHTIASPLIAIKEKKTVHKANNYLSYLNCPFRCVSDLPAIMRLRNQIIEEGKMKDNHPGQGVAKRRKIEFSDS